MAQMLDAARPFESYQRVALEEGHEDQGGAGNGIWGHDETSERLELSWGQPARPTPGSVPDFR